jgi:hypothetical protein
MNVIKMIDFENFPKAVWVSYGGDAGAKDAIIYNDAVWMLKYPKTTRDMVNPQISYTTSPLSEYLGSRIFASLGIPVHETHLGMRNKKAVVACRDFTRVTVDENANEKYPRAVKWAWPNKQLILFHDIKNTFMAGDLDAYSGTGSETLLDEVLDTIEGHTELKTIDGVTERFWDMFVVDAFIGNNDRNNGNWGVLLDTANGNAELAPVYDNGNAFYNKKSIANMEKRLTDLQSMREDAYLSPLCVYKYKGLDNEGYRINPFTFIKQGDNADCNAAVARFVQRVDMEHIKNIIEEIPETYNTLSVMPRIQKDYYLALMHLRLDFIKNI